MRVWKLEGKKLCPGAQSGAEIWIRAVGFHAFTRRMPPPRSLPCTPGSSKCSLHIFTYMSPSHRTLKLHISKYPNLPCQTSSSGLFPVLLNSTLHLSCSSGQNPQSHPWFLSFSRHPKYNPARSTQDSTTFHHSHCHRRGPNHHHPCLDYCNSLLRGFLFLYSLPFPIFLNRAARGPFLQELAFLLKHDSHKALYFLSPGGSCTPC